MAQDAAQAATEQRKRNSLLAKKLKGEQKTAEYVLSKLYCLVMHRAGALLKLLCAYELGRKEVATLHEKLAALQEQAADAQKQLGVHQKAAPQETSLMKDLQV